MTDEFVKQPKSWVIGPQPTKPPVNNPHNPLSSATPPTSNDHLTNKAYVDLKIAYYLSLIPAYDLSGYVTKVTPQAMTGSLMLPVLTRGTLDAVSKLDADTLLTVAPLQTGDTVRITTSGSFTGYLRCNGAILLQANYTALYAAIGAIFNSSGINSASHKLWQNQTAFNATQSANITGWTAGTALPGTVNFCQAMLVKNRVYLTQSYTGIAASSVLYTAPVDSGGVIGTWTTATALPVACWGPQLIAINTKAYFIGGYSGGTLSHVYSATINSDGTLGTWVLGTALPGGAYAGAAFVTKNRIYVLVGYLTAQIYTAPIDINGVIGAWSIGTAFPVSNTSFPGCIVTSTRVYILGGSYSTAVYYAAINSDGTIGTWTAGTALPTTMQSLNIVATTNRAYILGTNVGSAGSALAYNAPIDGSGVIGAWVAGTNLPSALGSSGVVVTSSRVYLLGGATTNETSGSSTVYYAAFTGGLDDYTSLLMAAGVNTSTQFTLPDNSVQDATTPGVYTYIKI